MEAKLCGAGRNIRLILKKNEGKISCFDWQKDGVELLLREDESSLNKLHA